MKILETTVLDIDNDTRLRKTLHMFTTKLILTSDFDEKLERKDDGLDYESVTTKTDTKFSCNSMPCRSKESESWTFVEVENNQDITDGFTENLRHNECLKDTETLECTGNNAKAGKMDQNCTVLRAKSLKFFEGSKFKRECEWTSSYFAKENTDDLQRNDKDFNGNYGYLAITNKTESSRTIICDELTSPLSKLNGKQDGIPVLEPQEEHGTSDPFEVNYQVISDDNSVRSAYKDIKQVGHDMRGYVSRREEYLVSSLHREHFDSFSSHDDHSSRNNPQEIQIPRNILNKDETFSDLEKGFKKELHPVNEGVVLLDKNSVSCEFNAKDVQDSIDVHTTKVSSQAESLNIKNHVQEEKIVPVSFQRQSACCAGLFEGSITLDEDNQRSCTSTDEWHEWNDDGDHHDEIVVIAVCDDDTVDAAAAANDADDNCVITDVNQDNTDVIPNNIRLTKWHADDGCHGDDTKTSLVSYYGNDPDGCHGDLIRNSSRDADDGCHGEDTKRLLISYHANDSDSCHGNVMRNIVSDADEKNDADDGCHGDSSKEFLVRSGTVDTEDDDNDDDEMDVNGGNPFDLDESEYQKLMEAIDDSFDTLLENNHSDEHDTGNPFEPCDELNLDLMGRSTEQNNINTQNEEVRVTELQEQMRNPFDESECNNILICEESLWGSENKQDDCSKCDENQGKEFEEQSEHQGKDNELANNSYHAPQTDESSMTQDCDSVEHGEGEINFVSSLENRTDAGMSELDKYQEYYDIPTESVAESLPLMLTENSEEEKECEDDIQEHNALNPFDVDLLVNANNGLLDDGVKVEVDEGNEVQEDCQDELEDVSECGNAALAETNMNTIVEEDGMVNNDEEDRKKQESNLLKAQVEPSAQTSDIDVKKDGLTEEVHSVTEDNEDQQDPTQSTSTIPVIAEPSTTSQEHQDQRSMDGNTFLSLLESHGILQPQSTQDEQSMSDSGLSNEDSASSTKDLSEQERIQNINKAFEWVRKELQEMRGMDFNLKVQFDGLRQEARSLREEYELFVNCEYYDDDEIFDEATEYMTCQKDSSDTSSNPVEHGPAKGDHCLDSKPLLLHNALREDSGYHSDTPSSSTDTGSTDNEKLQQTTHAHAKYYYQPQPTHPKIQELTSGKCVFELVL